jgi:hypothetical protein
MPPLERTPAQRLAAAVHGALWCFHDVRRERLLIWHGEAFVNVLSVATGEACDTPWPVDPEAVNTDDVVAVERAVRERLAAGY